MAGVKFFATPGYGERQLDRMHYHQAVRIGDRVEISGQGGWDDDFNFPEALEDEIVQAFDNVARTLAVAGAGWVMWCRWTPTTFPKPLTSSARLTTA